MGCLVVPAVLPTIFLKQSATFRVAWCCRGVARAGRTGEERATGCDRRRSRIEPGTRLLQPLRRAHTPWFPSSSVTLHHYLCPALFESASAFLLHCKFLIVKVVASGDRGMEIRRIGVVGAGTMGNGIAHVFASGGYEVALCDVDQKFVDRALQTISKNLDREVAKNKISASDKQSALARIQPVIDRKTMNNCDFVVEAATEKFAIKAEIFRDLDRICRPEIIMASNTSSISITKLGALTQRADKIIGMHFFNPVPVMKLIEVIRGLAT